MAQAMITYAKLFDKYFANMPESKAWKIVNWRATDKDDVNRLGFKDSALEKSCFLGPINFVYDREYKGDYIKWDIRSAYPSYIAGVARGVLPYAGQHAYWNYDYKPDYKRMNLSFSIIEVTRDFNFKEHVKAKTALDIVAKLDEKFCAWLNMEQIGALSEHIGGKKYGKLFVKVISHPKCPLDEMFMAFLDSISVKYVLWKGKISTSGSEPSLNINLLPLLDAFINRKNAEDKHELNKGLGIYSYSNRWFFFGMVQFVNYRIRKYLEWFDKEDVIAANTDGFFTKANPKYLEPAFIDRLYQWDIEGGTNNWIDTESAMSTKTELIYKAYETGLGNLQFELVQSKDYNVTKKTIRRK